MISSVDVDILHCGIFEKPTSVLESESNLYCSVVATLFHFGGEFVGVVLIER
jgi:hypothetical protein